MAGVQTVPLSRHPLFRSQDIDDARAQVARVFCDHRLDPVENSSDLDALQNRFVIGVTALNYLRYGAPVRIEPGELETFFLVQIPTDGRAHVTCGRETHVASANEASVLSPTGHVAMEWDRDCGQVIVWVERTALEQHLAETIGRSLRAPLHFRLGMRLEEPLERSWMRSVLFLLDELESGESCIAHTPGIHHFERTLMSGLLYSQPHNYSDSLVHAGTTLAPWAVRRAEEYIADHLLEDVSIEELARYSGASARSLYENFRKSRQTSPLAYLRELRLAGARRDLLRADRGDTVTAIALRWRFNELGRFGQIYRRRFGEVPSETLRKATASAPK